jgi:4-carboxymuconolactone decarboxylase
MSARMPRPSWPGGTERLAAIAPEAYDAAQRALETEMTAGPRGGVKGPFAVLIRSPSLADHAQRLGTFLRHDSVIPVRLREFAILIAVRFWHQPHEWRAHAAAALKAGVTPAAIQSLIEDDHLEALQDDEKTLYDFCASLHKTHFVEDDIYSRTFELIGERGLVELIGLCGYFTFISMVFNVARPPISGDVFEIPKI